MKNSPILFVNCCLLKQAETRLLPVGLASVMTYVEQHDYEIALLDIDINEYSDEYVEHYIRTNQYDTILIGTIVTHYAWVKWFCNTVKRYHPHTTLIVGNSVGGSCPEVFLSNAPADLVVVGEGEITTLEVLDALRESRPISDIPGIAFRDKSGQIVKNSLRKACNINELPMINWSFFDLDRYRNSSTNTSFGKLDAQHVFTMPVSTARGCAFKCTFCHYVFWDDPYRYRSPDSILSEIERNVVKLGATYINFWDDLSFASLPQLERLLEAILKSGLKFDWSAAIRSDLLGNPKYPYERRYLAATKMVESGCKAVGFSLESSNPEILKAMDKKVEPEFFGEQISILRKVGVTCNTAVVFGYPMETKQTIRDTFQYCIAQRIYPSIGFLMPLPYTKMYDYAKNNGYIVDEDEYLSKIAERQDIHINMTTLTDSEIMAEIKSGARELNELLDLKLTEETYIRTKGIKKHTNIKDQKTQQLPQGALDPEDVLRNENDFSFSYSQSEFSIDQGLDS